MGSSALGSGFSSCHTFKVTKPCSVNLQALLNRFNNDCLTLVISVWMMSILSPISILKVLVFFSASGAMVVSTSQSRVVTL